MHYSKGLKIGDKIIAMVSPILGGALFGAISIGIDLASDVKPDFLDPVYVFETAITSAAGAILSAALFAASYVISAAKYAERNYLSIPWTSESSCRQVQGAKLETAQAVIDLFDSIDKKLVYLTSQEIAVRAVRLVLEEQKQNLNQYGRLTFTSFRPQFVENLKHSSISVDSNGPDGYGLVFNTAMNGDVIYATDFQNSAHWWLDPKVAFSFFELNLEAIKRGVKIKRIFGRNHHKWREDESGAKQDLIELQAKIQGIEVYTIDYADFDERLGFDIQPIDHLILTKNAKPYPGIEWEIDAKGDTENVFYVLSESRLNEIAVNFQKLINSAERGSSLKRIEVKETYNPSHADDYKKIKAEFKRIALSLIRESEA